MLDHASLMNIADFILSQGCDAAPAVFSGGAALTYGELRQKVIRLGSGLLARGHGKGDRVGIFAENSSLFITVYLGIMRAGLVAVPFQTEIGEETFAKIVADARICEVLVSKRFGRKVRAWGERCGVNVLAEEAETGDWEVGPGKGFPETNPVRDLAALMFTSGSTGEPKGVMVTHRNIECNSRDIISYLGLTADDRAMVVLPFHYCFGMSLLHTVLMAGGSLVLNNQFKLYPETVLQEIQQKECTGLAGVPSTYQILLRTSRFRQMSFPRLRWFQQAGGRLPNTCIAEIRNTFPLVRYFLMYGQTEGTARLSYLSPERLDDKLGSIGKGLPSTRLAVLKSDGRPVKPGSEEIGEIVAWGDNIASGYWNDPSETAKFFRNGSLHTGDLARVDEDGFIFIVERERDIIKSGGNRVSAKEVEEVIAQLPEIVEVAVVGAPHELLGEAIKAFVVASATGGIAAPEVQAHCRRRLPAFMAPQEVILLKALPHNGSGKVLKRQLKEMAANRGWTRVDAGVDCR